MPAYRSFRAYARAVLRIIDARTGHPADAAPLRRGLTRVEIHALGHDISALRVLLVADVLVRALELGGTPVWALLSGAPDRTDRTELRADAAALGIRPLEEGRDLGQALGAAQVIHVVQQAQQAQQAQHVASPSGQGAAPKPSDGVLVAVAPVDPASDPPPATDPSVLRLALLSTERSLHARVDAPALDEARDTLTRWRRAVADWARSPSRPMPKEVRDRLRAAWEDDLDTPAVLRVLHWLENAPGIPDGARFETCAYADRLLGLELVRDLGAGA
ncbi:hypothetical protein ACFRI7_29210 [Streptomyces sp. NPDC056716]|uniref:hypothetical protein n=1 Tax=unclassified Streptomyces TaxID=2593676 RepID=UPI0036C944E1